MKQLPCKVTIMNYAEKKKKNHGILIGVLLVNTGFRPG